MLLAPLGPTVAWAADVVVGVNLVNAPYNLTVPEQETILNAMHAAGRLAHIEKNGLSECQPVGAARGKPCWFTEWGVGGASAGCPVDDAERSLLVREMRGYFAGLARQSQLKGAFYYNWQGFIHAPKEDLASALRCGALTASGRLAIAPL